MKRTAILLSLLLCLFSVASYAANIGDIVGGYPAGYNSNDPGDFQKHIGEPITPVFTPVTTSQPSAPGTVQGPFPAGFGYKPGTATPTDEFLDGLIHREKIDREQKSIAMRSSAVLRGRISDFTDKVTIVVLGNDSSNAGSIQYYVGYKLVNISW